MKLYRCLHCEYTAVLQDHGPKGPWCPVGYHEKSLDALAFNAHGKLHRTARQSRAERSGRFVKEIETGSERPLGAVPAGTAVASVPEPQARGP